MVFLTKSLLLQTYLYNNSQRSVINNYVNQIKEILVVTRDSIVGLLLCSIFLNSLLSECQLSEYVGDNNLYISEKIFKKITSYLEINFIVLHKHLPKKSTTANLGKGHYIGRDDNDPSNKIIRKNIEITDFNKIRICVDNKLNFKTYNI